MRLTIGLLWRFLTMHWKYAPQRITFTSLVQWLRQFPKDRRWEILSLLNYIRFVTAEQTDQLILAGHTQVLERLEEAGIQPSQIIYVSFDAAGSSSHVMLNMLRDRENLSRRSGGLLHSNDGDKMTTLSSQIGSGAVIYVDDFSGSGRQFKRNRNAIYPHIAGNFSEFFLATCICEEALEILEELGVEPVPGIVHYKNERPLHQDSTILDPQEKAQIIDVCRTIHPQQGLGFRRLATMVVLDRNAPNTTPLLFRGSLHQHPYRGIFPRWDDLPI